MGKRSLMDILKQVDDLVELGYGPYSDLITKTFYDLRAITIMRQEKKQLEELKKAKSS